jgi:hypothetical protein
MNDPAIKRSLETEGTEVLMSTSPAAFDAFLKKDASFWNRLIVSGGMKAFE